MKRLTLIFLLTWAGYLCHAQGQWDFNDPAIPGAASSEAAQVVSSHSVSLSVLGLEYAYERALGGYWSMVFRAGFPCVMTDMSRRTETETIGISNGGYQRSTSTSKSTLSFYFGPRPGITVEPRYYLNLQSRYLKGKKTANNAANFVSVQTKVYFPKAGYWNFSIVPAYGIRRGGMHWFREYTFGLAYHHMGVHIWPVFPHLGFRFGYTF